MNTNDVYGSKFLKCAMLNGKEHLLTIEDIGVATFKDGKKQIALHFMGKESALGLNVTNKNRIVRAYGEETDAWIGKQIIVYPDECDFQGDTVECIRVKIPVAAAAAHVKQKPTAPKPNEQEPPDEYYDDNHAPDEAGGDQIPF